MLFKFIISTNRGKRKYSKNYVTKQLKIIMKNNFFSLQHLNTHLYYYSQKISYFKIQNKTQFKIKVHVSPKLFFFFFFPIKFKLNPKNLVYIDLFSCFFFNLGGLDQIFQTFFEFHFHQIKLYKILSMSLLLLTNLMNYSKLTK